jgi:ribosomal RNA-processing protein 1
MVSSYYSTALPEHGPDWMAEKSTRDGAIDTLRTYLRSRKEFSELELLKLWKGLFYCMWMSDKPRNQQQLARDLAALVDIVPGDTVVPFLDAFWKTMAREWSGIGQLR